MQLTPHFTLAELTASTSATKFGIDNTPPPELMPRLVLLAEMLERIRTTLGVPVQVTSGYRCHDLNQLVGGVQHSDHVSGRAADIVAPTFGGATAIGRVLAPLADTLGIGQIIVERLHGRQWVHVSTYPPERPVNRVLTITDAGAVPGIVE